MYCEHCGRRLHRFEDETYCPDCWSYAPVEPAAEAGDEDRLAARLSRLAPAPAAPDGGPPLAAA